MNLRAALRPRPARTWVLAVVGVGVWTWLVSVVVTSLAVEGSSEGLTALSQWYDAADGLAITTLLVGLAVTAALRRRGADTVQVALAAPLLVLVPQAVLAARIGSAWRDEAPGLPLVGEGTVATTPGPSQPPVAPYVEAVVAGSLRLVPLVVVVVVLGWLVARWGSAGGMVVAAAWVTVLVAVVGARAALLSGVEPGYSSPRIAMQVVVTGEPRRLATPQDESCPALAGPLCGDDLTLLAAYPFPALALLLVAAMAVGWSRALATARHVRRRSSSEHPSAG